MHQPQPGSGNPASRIASIAANDEPPAGAVTGDRDTARFEAASKEVAITGDGVLDRRRKWVLGRKPVIERQRPASGGAASFSNQVPVAVE